MNNSTVQPRGFFYSIGFAAAVAWTHFVLLFDWLLNRTAVIWLVVSYVVDIEGVRVGGITVDSAYTDWRLAVKETTDKNLEAEDTLLKFDVLRMTVSCVIYRTIRAHELSKKAQPFL